LFFCSGDWIAFGCDNIPQIYKCILHYKSLVIITKDCNLVFGRILLPFVKLLLMIFFVTSFFALLRFYDQLNLIPLVLLILITYTTLLLLLPTTMVMSALYKTSKTFIRNLKPRIRSLNESINQKEILKGQLKSCGLIRCEIGGLYFMESKAKLTLIHKIVNGLKYLLVNVKL